MVGLKRTKLDFKPARLYDLVLTELFEKSQMPRYFSGTKVIFELLREIRIFFPLISNEKAFHFEAERKTLGVYGAKAENNQNYTLFSTTLSKLSAFRLPKILNKKKTLEIFKMFYTRLKPSA